MSEPRPPVTPWIWVAVVGSALLAGIGVATPRLALRAAVLTAIVVATIVLAHEVVQLLARVRPAAEWSAFRPAADEDRTQLLPRHVAAIRPDHVDDDTPLGTGARQALVSVTTERLWAGHSLNLYDPDHHDRIKAIVSPLLWASLQPRRYDSAGSTGGAREPLHRDLPALLDELDQL